MSGFNAATDANDNGSSGKLHLSRRHMMFAAGATAAFGLLPGWSRPPVLASGKVFHDRSGTGQRRPSDPGIAGVLVSNGRDVVRTDTDGRWQLALGDGDSVFVIKPANWAAPLGRGGLPRTAVLHHTRAHGDDAANEAARHMDFPLVPNPERDRFEALLIADPQPQDHRELSFLKADLAGAAMDTAAAFAIVHGDVAFDDLSLYPRYLDLIGATGLAWHHCPGNHDMDAGATDTRFAFETWKRTFGPCHYAFEHAQATFILLSNVVLTPGGPRSYGGEIPRDQLQFVRNVLAHTPRDRLVVVSMHIPLMASLDIADPVPDVVGRRELLHLLSHHPHTVSFSGHTHTCEHHYLSSEHGFTGPQPHHHQVLATMSGSWWGGPADFRGVPLADCQDGSPRGFHVLEVDGNTYNTRFVASSGASAGPGLRVSVEVDGLPQAGSLHRADLRSAHLAVNVFDGGPRSQVEFEITSLAGGSRPMLREKVVDPNFCALHAQAQAAFKSWVQPVASTHVWRAPLPNLPAGAHRVVVRCRDEFGRQRVSQALVEVAADSESSAATLDTRPT